MQSAMVARPGEARKNIQSIERASVAIGVGAPVSTAAAAPPPERCRWPNRAAGWLAALVCAGALAACGGGFFVGVELGGSNDRPPSVALTAAVSEAAAGATVRLVAAASDDFGVDAVSFYRQEAAGPPTLLATDNLQPYQLDATIPASPVGTVWRFFARAFDGAGQHGDSAIVEITVR
jgi:hypothetical protein